MMDNWYDGQGWGMANGMGWGGWLMLSLIVVVCLAFLATLSYVVQGPRNDLNPQSSDPLTRPLAVSTLDQRFARGDIDEEEYLRRRTVLQTR